MKVLIISNGKPTPEYPLNGNFEFDQAKALSIAGIEIVFFAIDLRSARRKRPWGITHGLENGVQWHIISLPVGAFPLFITCWIGSIALNYLYRKVFKTSRDYPNIIHAHFTNMGCTSVSLSKRYDIPLVITEHSSAMNSSIISKDILTCAKKGYSQASKVIAVSNPLKKSIFRNTSIEATVIQNMIRLDTFAQTKRVAHNGYHFVSVGSFIPRKRFDNLVKAFSEVARAHDDVFLHLIGDGPMKEELLKLSENLGSGKRIYFYGYRDSNEIASIFGKCDCFVLATARETFGVVYVEAMAVGLPVIATRCGGPEDFVNRDNGLLIDVDGHQQLCDAMENMYKNKSCYQETIIRNFAQSNFSPEVVSNKIINLYHEVLCK